MITYDPGVGGGFAVKGRFDDIITLPIPAVPKNQPSLQFSEWLYDMIAPICEKAMMLSDTSVVYVEAIGPRPCDTPKTAFRLSAAYHIALAVFRQLGATIKLVRPIYWQQQLGIAIPSGVHNYGLRKKIFKDFATHKYPAVTTMFYRHNLKKFNTQHKKKPTGKTADAVCMLWVFSGDK